MWQEKGYTMKYSLSPISLTDKEVFKKKHESGLDPQISTGIRVLLADQGKSWGCSTNSFVIKWVTQRLWKYLYGAATP